MLKTLPMTLEGVENLPGQLWPKERIYLQQVVSQIVPTIVLEIGCGCGAGSTYAMARGLRLNGSGELFTCDTDPERLGQAKKLYERWGFVKIRDCRSEVLIQWLLDTNRYPQLMFFDGPEDTDTALRDCLALQARIPYGTHLICHDWNEPHSIKMKKLRPHLEQHPLWQEIRVLQQPESLGMAHFQWRGKKS